MDFCLEVGMRAELELTVEEQHTAMAFGSGRVRVFATPMMIGLMEKAALSAVDEHLGQGYATVGTLVNVKHLASTPMGMRVKTKAELIGIEGKKLTFNVEAWDEKDKIGEGIHERYIIELDKFIKRTEGKVTI